MDADQLKICQFSTGCRYLGVRDDNTYECLKKTEHRETIDQEVYKVIPSLIKKPNALLLDMLPLGDFCEGV